MAIRAVLFDVGGPIDTEVESERLVDLQIREAFAAEGVAVDAAAYREANDYAVRSFAPDAYAAIVWRMSGSAAELARRVAERFIAGAEARHRLRGGLELRPGIGEVIASLHADGLLLGLCANQSARVLADLERHGLSRYFADRSVSGTTGLRKPDPRLFLHVCDALGASPAECVMVGDRVDNDIAPAKALGMKAVLIRTGRHIAQQPRSAEELPDVEVHDAAGIATAVRRLVAEGG